MLGVKEITFSYYFGIVAIACSEEIASSEVRRIFFNIKKPFLLFKHVVDQIYTVGSRNRNLRSGPVNQNDIVHLFC